MKKIAFYAPVKPPDHPIPSGDREISRLLIKAMQHAGHRVDVASKYIAYQKRPGDELFETRRTGGQEEANRLIAEYLEIPKSDRPEVWFTYHTYCKAPDYLGPTVSQALGIPYITAEACRTRQNTDADWQSGRQLVQNSIRFAQRNFCLKPSDKDYLLEVLDEQTSVRELPPFVDELKIQSNAKTNMPIAFSNNDPIILTAGMMRPGKKAECYSLLAKSLEKISYQNWNLIIVGDGPERGKIEEELSFVPSERIIWTGLINPEEVHGYMKQSDIFAWPGYKEPIGMVYLEAQALGVPVAAMASLGVPTVVKHGQSGLLCKEADTSEYAEILNKLISNDELRKSLGNGGVKNIRDHHGIEAAANLISAELEAL